MCAESCVSVEVVLSVKRLLRCAEANEHRMARVNGCLCCFKYTFNILQWDTLDWMEPFNLLCLKWRLIWSVRGEKIIKWSFKKEKIYFFNKCILWLLKCKFLFFSDKLFEAFSSGRGKAWRCVYQILLWTPKQSPPWHSHSKGHHKGVAVRAPPVCIVSPRVMETDTDGLKRARLYGL